MITRKTGLIREHRSKLIVLERLTDMLVIAGTLLFVLEINFMQWETWHTWWLLISIVNFQIFAEFNDLYKESRGASFSEVIRKILISWFFMVVILIVVEQFFWVMTQSNQKVFIYWCIAAPIELILLHAMILKGIGQFRRMGRNHRRVAIIGNTQLGHELEGIFQAEDWMGLNFVGFFDDRLLSRDQKQQQILSGNLKKIIHMAKTGEVDMIYITLALNAETKVKDILADLSDTTASVYFVPDLFVFDLLRSNLSFIQGIPVISMHDTPFYGVDSVLKRLFDVVLSTLILIIIAIPLLLIALSIKLTSPGDVLFKQRRYGFLGEEIVVWKFRSMTVSEDGESVHQAKKNDPRVTKLGAFLRRNSLDELPQFFNVLQGHMSIIGPRPHAVVHNEFYRNKISGYMLRHKVKPGITGLAQISGFRGETDTLDKMEGRVRYDLEYIQNWSLWLDVKIILLTIINCCSSSKVY
mgnify:CR=1 FL=1